MNKYEALMLKAQSDTNMLLGILLAVIVERSGMRSLHHKVDEVIDHVAQTNTEINNHLKEARND